MAEGHRCLTGVPLWLYDDDHSYNTHSTNKNKNSNGVRVQSKENKGNNSHNGIWESTTSVDHQLGQVKI